MNTYVFRTTTTIKPHNNKVIISRWCIHPDIITPEEITAGSLREALEIYREIVANKHYVEISRNAIKNKSPMYIDTPDGTKQVGYVITAKTEFEDRDNYKWSTQYIDLWIEINIKVDADFPEEV